MAKLSQSYETIIVFSCKDEEAIPGLVEKFTNLIADNATVDSVEEWGKRKLAYTIDYETEGYYVMIHFTSVPSFPAELDRNYNITDGIVRSLIIAKD